MTSIDHETASALMHHYSKICAEFNAMTEIVSAFPDADEQRRLRKPLGAIAAHLYTDFVLPLITKYPDLDPDGHSPLSSNSSLEQNRDT